jgi:hypothetical protein
MLSFYVSFSADRHGRPRSRKAERPIAFRTLEHVLVGEPASTSDQVRGNVRASVSGGRQLVLRLRLEVAGVVPFVELIRGIAAQSVDLAAAFHRRALADQRHPALQMLVVLHRQEFATAILVVLRRHVGCFGHHGPRRGGANLPLRQPNPYGPRMSGPSGKPQRGMAINPQRALSFTDGIRHFHPPRRLDL